MAFFSDQNSAEAFDAMTRKVYEEITRFWFILDAADAYGPNNIGVSSYSLKSAADIIDSQIHLLHSLSCPNELVRV